jgi:hypothetical protein
MADIKLRTRTDLLLKFVGTGKLINYSSADPNRVNIKMPVRIKQLHHARKCLRNE